MTVTASGTLWPVEGADDCLVVTHWPPDIDGLATAAAWCALAGERAAKRKVSIHVGGPMPARMAWLLEGAPVDPDPDWSRYDACLILDGNPQDERVSAPRDWLDRLAANDRLFVVDHHANARHLHDGRRIWVEDVPAVACCFVDRGLFHPLFFSSLWSDTRRLTVNTDQGATYLARLFRCGLTEAEVARQTALLEPRRPEVLLRDLTERTRVVSSTLLDGVGLVLVVASEEPWRHSDTIHEVRQLLTHYGDVVAVVDQKAGRVSLWATPDSGIDLATFARTNLGGGGHATMAGGPQGESSPEMIAAALCGYLKDKAPCTSSR